MSCLTASGCILIRGDGYAPTSSTSVPLLTSHGQFSYSTGALCNHILILSSAQRPTHTPQGCALPSRTAS